MSFSFLKRLFGAEAQEGGSLPPIEELKIAGVDLSTPAPVCEALDYFAELILSYKACQSEENA